MWSTRGTVVVAAALVACTGLAACERAAAGNPQLRTRLAAVAEAWAARGPQAAWDRSVVVTPDLRRRVVRDSALPEGVRARLLSGETLVPQAIAAQAEASDNVEVSYRDGGPSQRVATLGVAETVAALAEGDPPACRTAGRCAPLVVTAVAPATTVVPTSRGDAVVPAWEVVFEGERLPLVIPSVAELRTPDEMAAIASLPPTSGTVGGPSVRLDQRRGRTLAVLISVSACATPATTEVVQIREVVVVGYLPGSPTSGACDAAVQDARVTITLDAPVGDRPVVDAFGRPLLREDLAAAP